MHEVEVRDVLVADYDLSSDEFSILYGNVTKRWVADAFLAPAKAVKAKSRSLRSG